ncbi:ComEC/Rec2 family competence protein [Chryseobacterium sp. RLHN22]|uniref:ComEC/Rec2 family competence protein n=1 Tax=Chryseobacterium sp. RLHN22 TaxID=3437885 RepID=UPI003D9B45A3
MSKIFKVVTSLYANTFAKVDAKGQGISKVNTLLMGSFVKLLNQEINGWQQISAFSQESWIRNTDIGENPALKCFYVDVGQGDGALLEVGNDQDGLKIIIDGGPNDNLSRYLSNWQYKYYFKYNKKVHIDYIFVSHFDKDHYQGLIDIINDDHYTIGTIYHNGIAKFNKEKENYPKDKYNSALGEITGEGDARYLVTSFDNVIDFRALKETGMQDLMQKFLSSVNNAFASGRLGNFTRLDHTSPKITKTINNKEFRIEILGPVTSIKDGKVAFKFFDDYSHTINGHSLVLKIVYGNRSFLFGGDLNVPSEDHLLQHYGDENPFEVDVAKSCHHGASEFTLDFMEKLNPFATVISSGDNETYSHPRADAIGCAGKYSKSLRPLVFSTELARSYASSDKIRYGMINLRCDGERIIMAQMKEVISDGKVWDLYDHNFFETNP